MARLREAYPPSIQLPADGVRLRDPVDCCACAPSKCCNDPAEWKTRRNTKPRAEVADCCCHPVKSDKRAQLAAEQAKKDHLCFPKGADAECCPKKNENDECCVDGTCLPSGTDAKQKEKPGGCCAKFDESGNKVEEDCCVNNQEECCPTGGKKKEAGAAGGGCCAKGGVSTNGNGAVKSPAKSSALKVKAVKAGPVIEKKPPVKCCAVVEKEDPECCPNDIRAEGDDCCYRAPCLPKPVKAVKKGTVKAPVVVGDGGRSGNSPSGGEASVTVAPKSEEVVKAPKKSNGFFGKKAKAGAEVPGGVAVDGAAPPAAGVPAPAVTSDGADVKAAAPKKAVVSGKGWFGKKEKSEKAPVVVA